MNIFKRIDIDEIKLEHSSEETRVNPVSTRISLTNDFLVMSPLSRFIITPVVLNSVNSLYLPCDNIEALQVITREIAPHFQEMIKYKTLTNSNILLKSLRDDSKRMLEDSMGDKSEVDTFLQDLNPVKIKNDTPIGGDRHYYKVDLNKITPTPSSFFESIWDFWSNTFLFRQNAVYLTPSCWSMSDSFKEHITVRVMANYCNNIVVVINPKSNIIESLIIQ